MKIPTAKQYKTALKAISISAKQRQMLEAHYRAHNRTITYSQLAHAAGAKTYKAANSGYGRLGRKLGLELDFPFTDLDPKAGTKFQSSAIGMGINEAYSSTNQFELVMHHELAKALDQLDWFPN